MESADIISTFRLLQDSFREISCLQLALKSVVCNVDSEYGKQIEEFLVGFEGRYLRTGKSWVSNLYFLLFLFVVLDKGT